MKSIRLILVLIISVILFSSNIKAQQKVGVIIMVEDSLITHLHIGWTIIELNKTEYELPFNLEDNFFYMVVDSVFKSNSKTEFIHLDKKLYKDYSNSVKNLRGKKLKKHRKSWINEVKTAYDIDAIIVITNANIKIVYGMNGNSVDVGKICFNTGTSDGSNLYIKMMAYIFMDGKPKKIKSSRINSFSKDYPRKISKKETYTPEQFLTLEKPLKELIQLQIAEFKTHPNYKNMLALLRHQAALEKYNKMNPK